MIESGYFTGKILDKNNKPIGTICSKNKNNIKHELNEYELGLLKTKAGIPYRDENLSSTASEILIRRNDEVRNSTLVSSSKYVKKYKGVLK